MFRPRLRLPRIGITRPALPRRSIHHVPHIRDEFKNGVPGLLSAEGFDIAWTEYMNLMVGKLNTLVAGTDYEHKDMKAIINATAREPSLASLFNHASMAHNNTIFFQNLSPRPVAMPSSFKRALEASFSSIETLRREFIVTAQAMFGPGFVWLVRLAPSRELGGGGGGGGEPRFRLLTTYLAGSPYPGAHWRRQVVDMNTVGGASDAAQSPVVEYLSRQAGGPPQPPAPVAAVSNAPEDWRAPGGVALVPLLCLNTWEHVWLRDYGFGADGVGGKALFAERWWDAVDWEKVAGDANVQPRRREFMA